MAPAANTAKPRRAAAAQAGSDSDSDHYQARLQEAESARARLRKAKETRDLRRKALATAYHSSLSAITSRIQKSIANYQGLYAAMYLRHLKTLESAGETRHEKTEAIVARLADLQRLVINHGTQLGALYRGRRRDVEGVLAEEKKEGGGIGQQE